MRKFAILDVDDTLLYNINDINKKFLQTLVDNNVTDVILFTKMSLDDIRKKATDTHVSRVDLIAEMKKMGITTHFVTVPQDCAYDKGIAGDYFDQVYTPHYQEMEEQGFQVDTPSQYDIDRTMAKVLLDQVVDVSRGEIDKDVTVRSVHSFENQPGSEVNITNYLNGNQKMLLYPNYTDIALPNVGKGYKTEKGFMAELLLSRLCAVSSEPLALFVADDKNDCLIDFREAAKRAMNSSGHQINVTTFNIPRQWTRSQSHNYDQEIDRYEQNIALSHHRYMQLDDAIEKLMNGWWFEKDSAKETIQEHILHHGKFEHWLALAAMAEQGVGLYKNNQSIADAYQLLTIAMLRAQGTENYHKAQEQLVAFMQAHRVDQLFQQSRSNVVVATMENSVDLNKTVTTDKQLLTAHDLLNFLKTHALNPMNKTSQSQMLRNRLASQYLKRIEVFTSKIAQTQEESTIAKLRQEIKSAQNSLDRLRTISAKVESNPLAWDTGSLNKLEIDETSKQSIAASSSNSSHTEATIAASSSTPRTSLANHLATFFANTLDKETAIPEQNLSPR